MRQHTTTLRFHYSEVMDQDHTMIWVELIQDGAPVHVFTNFPARWDKGMNKDIYGNQSEDFQLPTLEAALAMMRSSPSYREVQPIRLAALLGR